MKKKVEVILRTDVPKLGKALEIKEVTYGYFRNHLVPHGLAELATQQAKTSLKERQEKQEAHRAEEKAEMQKQAEALKDEVITFKKKAADDKKIYGSVSAEDITQVLQERGFKGSAVLDKPLKEIGEHTIPIDFGHHITSEILIRIEAEA